MAGSFGPRRQPQFLSGIGIGSFFIQPLLDGFGVGQTLVRAFVAHDSPLALDPFTFQHFEIAWKNTEL